MPHELQLDGINKSLFMGLLIKSGVSSSKLVQLHIYNFLKGEWRSILWQRRWTPNKSQTKALELNLFKTL